MAATAGVVIKRVTALLMKWCRQLEVTSEYQFTITKVGNDRISLSTDSFIYDAIYNPSMGDVPEWGYKKEEEFVALLDKLGWAREHQGGGILTLYKD